MSKEELLIKRVKVINPYPFSPWEVGDILQMDANNEWLSPVTGYCESSKKIVGDDMDKYPNLFQPLEWWQDRAAIDMARYVKDTRHGAVYKVLNPFNGEMTMAKVYTGRIEFRVYYRNLLPATESEFLTYLNQTK